MNTLFKLAMSEVKETKIPKIVKYYKLICPTCKETIELQTTEVVEVHGIGAGRDYDGHYDSGRTQVRATCTECLTTITKSKRLEDCLGDSIFAIMKKI